MKVLKDAALEAYYQALFQMYGLPGWKFLMEDVDVMRAQYDTARGLTTAQELHFRQGELVTLDWLATHQDTVERAYAHLIQDQEGGEVSAPTGGLAKVIS